MTIKQWLKIKSFIVNANNCLNKVFYTFHYELSSGFRLVDIFPNYFSFHLANYKDKESKEAYFYKPDKIFKNTLMKPSTVIIISDISIKNNFTISILHVHLSLNDIERTIHYAVNITLTKAELFVIRYRVNQAIQISGVFYIIVITNFIHLVKNIFDSTTHFYQIQSIAITQDLKTFSNKNA